MSKSLLRTALLGALLAFTIGCQQQSQDAAAPAVQSAQANSPDAVLMATVKSLKNGDFDGLMKNALPPAEYARIKADWGKDQEPISDEDRAKFAETIGKLTAPDAEKTLFAEIEPQLSAFDAQYQQQVPMYVAMGTGWLQSTIQQNKDMSEEAKTQALAAVNALGKWVTDTRFTDPDKVKQVLAIAVKGARDLNLKTLDEARALSYDEGMAKGRAVFGSFKDALKVYGLSLDDTLDSIKAEVVSNDGKNAKLKLSYTLLGTPLTGEAEMVQVDGRWYGKDTIDKLNEKALASNGAGNGAVQAAEGAAKAPSKD
ncbi:MAG: hypothetical protein KIS89_08565 [Dokdonella sp.]|nr:hypothetical protein [Dokdonella sp.]